MRLQSALSMHDFGGLEEFGRRTRRQRRRPKKSRKHRSGLVRARRREASEPEVLEAEVVEERPSRGVYPWSPAARMGQHLRIQARQGHRAAVLELRPGLFLVAEVPEKVAREEFGILPLLAPLVVRAATKAITHPKPREERLLTQLVQAAQQRALPGPVEATEEEEHALVPAGPAAPALPDWADEDDLSGLLPDPRRGRHP